MGYFVSKFDLNLEIVDVVLKMEYRVRNLFGIGTSDMFIRIRNGDTLF